LARSLAVRRGTRALTGRALSASKPFWTNSLLSIVDQVLLSGLNFAVGMCLIRFGTKSDYGLYSQLFAASLFAVGVLEALIGSPMVALAAHMDATERAQMVLRLRRFQWGAGLALGLLFGIGAGWVVHGSLPELDAVPAGLAFGLYVFTSTLREFRRSVWYMESDLGSLLLSDGAYVLVALGLGGLLWWLNLFGASAVLGALSLANLLAGLLGRGPSMGPADGVAPPWHHTLAQIWDKGKWAVPGTAVAWLGSYGFLYLTSAMSGVQATADVSAARLPLVPVGLMVVAWSRVARPVAGRMLNARDWSGLNRLTWASLGAIELLTVVYLAMLMLAFPWLESHVLSSKYQGVHPLVWAWGVFFLVTVPRNIAGTWMVSIGAFRQLFIEACVVVSLMGVVASVLIPRWGAMGAVLALIVMETFDTAVMAVMIWRHWKRIQREAALSQTHAVT
jgi:O-antigen/teichoic acid export membrane protein